MDIITESHAIRMVSLLALRGALRLEIKGMTRRGRSAVSIARDVTGTKARSKVAVLSALEFHIVAYTETHGLPRPLFAS